MLPSPETIQKILPLLTKERDFILSSRKTAIDILQRRSSRLLCIAGPCSVHDRKSVLEYAKRLKELSQRTDFYLVMRVFVEKSRSKASWKGFLYDPDLDGSENIEKGIYLTRELLLELAQLGIPCAAEFLDPLASYYYSDLITYGLIGARSNSSLIHRQMASRFDFPIGFKNDLTGNLESSILGVEAARFSQRFLGINASGTMTIQESCGNPYSHLVLRGSNTQNNYHPNSIHQAIDLLSLHGLESNLIVDCSHGNSGKDFRRQCSAFESVVQQILGGNKNIAGLMLESHLHEGKQPHLENPSQMRYGVSITDSCIGWEETEDLLLLNFQHRSIPSKNDVSKSQSLLDLY